MPGVSAAGVNSPVGPAGVGEPLSLTEKIKAQAHRLGFQLVGVTTPDPPPHFEVYSAWLEACRHGEMAYLDTDRVRQRRADPRQILPECRSILVLGVRYPAAGEAPGWERLSPQERARRRPATPSELARSTSPAEELLTEVAGRGWVASYAWGADYHQVLPERLKALVAFIEAELGAQVPNRCYTDTGPVLERDLAQRAGLGWIGKNTCLINQNEGSYFLLAEILLGLELQPDTPFLPDLCGGCTRCLEACPTSCILPDRTLDASRCISYLTIELKGAIPIELRPNLGQWVFGCDICQQVCPWNLRFASADGDPAFAPHAGTPFPDLLAELSLTPEELHHKFKDNPVKRAKRKGYLRNVAVALGNAGDAEAVPALAQALLHDPEPLVRAHSAWALGRLGGAAARQALEQAAQIEAEANVLSEIQVALEEPTGAPVPGAPK